VTLDCNAWKIKFWVGKQTYLPESVKLCFIAIDTSSEIVKDRLHQDGPTELYGVLFRDAFLVVFHGHWIIFCHQNGVTNTRMVTAKGQGFRQKN
jgi:hypothetical protein